LVKKEGKAGVGGGKFKKMKDDSQMHEKEEDPSDEELEMPQLGSQEEDSFEGPDEEPIQL